MNNKLSPFDSLCYKKISTVPAGKVITYKELAKLMGTRAYRAVGSALGRNPNAPKVPCHRVVRSDGQVGGYAFGTPRKIALLRKEGIEIKQGKVVELNRVLFKKKQLVTRVSIKLVNDSVIY